MRASVSPISRGVWMKSTHPASMALLGIPGKLAEASSCASVTPPAALIACRPREPSDPVPESTIPTALWPRSAASDWNRKSTGIDGCRPSGRGWRRSASPPSESRVFGGMM